MKKKEDISDSDKKSWEDYIKNPKDVFDKDLKSTKVNLKRKRYKFDLHGYTLLDANSKIKEIIAFCQAKGFKEILLITGKGMHSNTETNTYVSSQLSKLRYSIPDFIRSDEEISKKVLSISSADADDGGEGALIIKLKIL